MSEILPRLGPIAGGTIVTVKGTGFEASDNSSTRTGFQRQYGGRANVAGYYDWLYCRMVAWMNRRSSREKK